MEQLDRETVGTAGDDLFYHWDFGNGLTSTDVNPSTSYSLPQHANDVQRLKRFVPGAPACSTLYDVLVTLDPTVSGCESMRGNGLVEPMDDHIEVLRSWILGGARPPP